MARFTVHTKLAPGREAEYEQVHATIPPDLDTALRAAGVHAWTIWRDGAELFHLIEVDDFHAMNAELDTADANLRWQAKIAGLLDDPHAIVRPLPTVWELPRG